MNELSITIKMKVFRILNKELGNKEKKGFFTYLKKTKIERFEFCKKMIARNISGNNIY